MRVWILALGMVWGCGQNPFPIVPRLLARPVAMALVCFDRQSGEALDLANCTPTASSQGRSLHALVLQETRGEIASIDLDARQVNDSDPAIPGATHVPTMALPRAIVVPKAAPRCAFVSSESERAIQAIDLRRFRREGFARAEDPDPFPLPAPPAGLVLDPDERALWVALPERSSVMRIEIDGCIFGESEEIVLSGVGGRFQVGKPEEEAPGNRYCPLGFEPAPWPSPAISLDVPVLAPAPSVLASGPELLVGDRRLPLIHRIDWESRSLLPPLVTGAPIRDLVITPMVPDSLDPNAPPSRRYIYAIDDRDGSVLVLDHSDELSEQFGALLPVGAASALRPERIPGLLGARALEVLTPRYDEANPWAEACFPERLSEREVPPAPSVLRGVFVAAAMDDGSIRFIDVFDADALCRGRAAGDPADCASTVEPYVYIRRHRPRIGERRLLPWVNLAEVALSREGSASPLDPQGSEFDTIDCPQGMKGVFGSDGERVRAKICASPDPFEAAGEVWRLRWQGALGSGRPFEGVLKERGEWWVLESGIDPCGLGVLGSAAIAEAPEPERSGEADAVALLLTLPVERRMDRACQEAFGLVGGRLNEAPLIVQIEDARLREDGRGELWIKRDALLLEREGEIPLAQALGCLRDRVVRFEVRVRGAYTVFGSRTGLRHRVKSDAMGRCRVDSQLSVFWQSRARPGELYRNAALAFRIALRPSSGSPEFRMVFSGLTLLNLDIGALTGFGTGRGLALPVDVHWSAPIGRLYVLDVSRRGLLEVEVEPLRYTTRRFE
ncbi:MAG: hypothetical protein RMJ84_02085 [Sandaracinaceae bacterium]|nr:hypothetical protein [Sandaracinaceae bacterium]